MRVQRLTVSSLLIIALAVAGCGRTLPDDAGAARIAHGDDRPATARENLAQNPDDRLAAARDDTSRRAAAREAGGSGDARDAFGGAGGRRGGAGGAAGAPFGPSGRKAAGAPVNIPRFQIEGTEFHGQRQFVIDTIIAACGDGTQCVNIAVSVEDTTDDAEPCFVLEETPPQRIERGGTITFRVAAPCGADGSPLPDGPGTGSGGQVPDSEQPAPGPDPEKATRPDTTAPGAPAGTTDPTSGEGTTSGEGSTGGEQTAPATGESAEGVTQAAGTSDGGTDVDG